MANLAEQAERIRRRELDPVELVQQHLARIDERESDVRAWVIVDRDGALQQAKRLRDSLDAAPASPLLGAIVAIKDIVDVAGFPTRSGAAWTSAEPATADAPLVAGLRNAGGIILGKTVTTELACFDPPPTRNPIRLDRTPGGSSSGSAAAVSSGMCQVAVGSQTGGSITRPASFCGVLGMKPTFGAVSLQGVAKVSLHLDHPGPIARSVDDLFATLTAMQTTTRELPIAGEATVDGLRIARADNCSGEPSADVARLFRTAMTQLGVERAASIPDSFSQVHTMHRRIMFADAAHHYADPWMRYEDQFSECIASVIREGNEVTKDEYIEAAKHQIRIQRDLLDFCFAECDVLATPATVTTAPSPETTGDPAFNSPWSYAGFPTLSIPCGVDSEGLPASIQWIARPHHEHHLQAVGRWCEQRLEP